MKYRHSGQDDDDFRFHDSVPPVDILSFFLTDACDAVLPENSAISYCTLQIRIFNREISKFRHILSRGKWKGRKGTCVKPQNIPRIAGIMKNTPENGVEQLTLSGAANDFSFFSAVRPEWSGTGRVAIGRQLHIQRRLDMAVHIENVEAHAVQMAILAFLVDTECFQGGHFVSAAFS